MARNTKAGVRIAIGSDFDPKGFLAAEARSARLAEMQLANSGTMAGAWVSAGQSVMTLGSQVETVGRGMSTAGRTLTRDVTLPIVAIGGASLTASVEFESAFAGVTKTVEATGPQIAALKQGIRDMAMELPASREEIAGVAAAAGQLGIQTPKILDFTRVMVDLGESTNLSAEEGATALARFANITQMSQDDFSNLGSSIVALGNNMATTEAEIADFALRIAGAGEQVGMTEPQILAIGAALSSVGIDAEAGGTAISKTMIGIESAVQSGGEQLELWASTAGMSAADFTAAWESDPASALNTVVQGLANMEAQGGSTLQQLELLGITEVRQRDALLRAAGAGDILTQALQISGEAWTENTALAEEAGKRYETTESQLEILKNKVTDVGVTLGDALAPALMDALEAAQPMLEAVRDMAERFADLDPQQQQQIIKWVAIAAAAGPVLSLLGGVTQGLGAMINIGGQTIVTLGKLGYAVTHVSETITAMNSATLLAKGGYVALAAAAGYAIGTLINQIPAVKESADAMAEAAAEADNLGEYLEKTGEREKTWVDYVFPMVGGIQTIAGALGFLAGQTEEVSGLTSDFGLVLDENGVPTEESIEALKRRNEALRKAAEVTQGNTDALYWYRDALVAVHDQEMGAEGAEIALERAKLRLLDAQTRYDEVLAEYPAGSREAMEAELDLRDATLNLEEAQIRSSTAQKELNKAISDAPRPREGEAAAWVLYYQAIGDAAGAAAAKANAANTALMGGRARSGTGGYNIPVYGTGADLRGVEPHVAVVGDEDELIFPLGDRIFADRYLPVLLDSLGLQAPVVQATPYEGSSGVSGMTVNIQLQELSYSEGLRAFEDIARGLVSC